MMFQEDHARRMKDPKYAKEFEAGYRALSVGVAVCDLREKRGLTQTELARRSGIRQPHIARLEKGDHVPNLQTLWRIVMALDGVLELHADQRVVLRERTAAKKALRRSA